jgi:hypothetical protein
MCLLKFEWRSQELHEVIRSSRKLHHKVDKFDYINDTSVVFETSAEKPAQRETSLDNVFITVR